MLARELVRESVQGAAEDRGPADRVQPGTTWAWLIRFRATMSSQSLTYTTLFGGTVTFDFEEIRSIRLESGIRGVEDRFKPFVRIVIEPLKESRQKPTYVNAKLLTKVDLAELRQTLRARFVSMGRSDLVKEL